MRGLTLYQPWAHLVCVGAKRFETRSWKTSYRGTLAIHAGSKWTPALALKTTEPMFGNYCFPVNGIVPFRFGAIICVVELVDCQPAYALKPSLGAEEIAFGDYSEGRWAWQLECPRILEAEIDCRGRQGLWEVPAELEGRIWQAV